MDIFPYLYAPGYFEKEYEPNAPLKKFFVVQVPITLYKNNIENLLNKDNNNLESQFKFEAGKSCIVNVSVVRSRRNNKPDQIQLSLKSQDSKEFITFRELLYTGDLIVLLKYKGELKYDLFGYKKKSTEADVLLKLNNKFYFDKNSITKVFPKNFSLVSDKSNIDEIQREKGAQNILLYGVPGSGKSHFINENYCRDQELIERVVFHPDYTYSDFVGQILPQVENEQLKYEFTPGPFTSILKKAIDEPNNMFFLVIEELNRGNAPAVFGEIFQLLDRDIEGTSKYSITNFDIAKYIFHDKSHKIRLPSNLWIIASMNTSDQNVFTLDTAFQRRWKMKHIKIDFSDAEHASHKIEGSNITWESFVTCVNKTIIEANEGISSTEDKRLGPYFVLESELSQKDTFAEKVLKYLWDDALKNNREVFFKPDLLSFEDVLKQFTVGNDSIEAVVLVERFKEMNNENKSESATIESKNESEHLFILYHLIAKIRSLESNAITEKYKFIFLLVLLLKTMKKLFDTTY